MTADLRAELRSWVAGKVRGIAPAALTDETALFEGRHLKSLHIPDLILVLERLRGRMIDVTDLWPGDFRDIDTMVERFLAASTEAAR